MGYECWIPILKKEVVIEHNKAPKKLHSSVHQMDHLDRVWARAERLGKELNADLEALVAIVYLHDIGRQYGLELHGLKSAEYAKDVLGRINFPKSKRGLVLHAIEVHDYQTNPNKRDSLEAKILYDADKLDALGDIGIKRFTEKYLVEKRIKMSIPEMLKIIEARWETLMLPETKELAREDYLKIKKHFGAML